MGNVNLCMNLNRADKFMYFGIINNKVKEMTINVIIYIYV